MGAGTVKVEIEVPREIMRFLEAFSEFADLDAKEYLTRCVVNEVAVTLTCRTFSASAPSNSW